MKNVHRTKSPSGDEPFRVIPISFPPDVASYLDADAEAAGLNRSAYVARLVQRAHTRRENDRARRQQATESPPAESD